MSAAIVYANASGMSEKYKLMGKTNRVLIEHTETWKKHCHCADGFHVHFFEKKS